MVTKSISPFQATKVINIPADAIACDYINFRGDLTKVQKIKCQLKYTVNNGLKKEFTITEDWFEANLEKPS